MHGIILQSKEYFMTFIETFKNFINEKAIPSCKDGIKIGVEKGTQWLGYAVTHLKALPSHMKQDVRVAAGTFITANFAFFWVAKRIAAAVDNHLLRDHAPHATDQIKFKNRILDVIAGLAVFGFNAILSKVCEYPLSRPVQAAFAINAMILRSFFS